MTTREWPDILPEHEQVLRERALAKRITPEVLATLEEAYLLIGGDCDATEISDFIDLLEGLACRYSAPPIVDGYMGTLPVDAEPTGAVTVQHRTRDGKGVVGRLREG